MKVTENVRKGIDVMENIITTGCVRQNIKYSPSVRSVRSVLHSLELEDFKT